MFYTYSVSHLHVILSVILWYFMYYMCYRQMQIYNNIKPEYEDDYFPSFYKPDNFQRNMLLLGIGFCTFGCTGGDFLHYYELFDLNAASDEPIHYEQFYYYLTQILPHNYYLWRFCVWGTAFFIVYLIIHNIDTDADIAYIVFVLYLLNYFSNPRQSLGVVLLLLGIILLTRIQQSSTPILTTCLSLVLISSSAIFHSTMYAFIAVAILCFIPGIKSKYFIIMAFCALPFLYYNIQNSTQFIANFLFSSNDEALKKTTHYLESDFRVTSNLFGWLKIIINRAPYVLIMLITSWRVFFKNENVSYLEKHLLMFALILVYISILFAGNNISAFLSTRMWDTALYPLAFFSMIYFRNHWEDLFIRYISILLLFSNTYNLLYEIYSVDKLNAEFAL